MARLLAARGYELILCARREERLRELAAELPVPCRIIAADVSDEQECRLLYEAVQSEELEVVINNAGFGLFGEFVTADLDEGPIVEQDTVRVTHAQSPADYVSLGRDVEAQVLARAIHAHIHHRVFLNGARTVVFPASPGGYASERMG